MQSAVGPGAPPIPATAPGTTRADDVAPQAPPTADDAPPSSVAAGLRAFELTSANTVPNLSVANISSLGPTVASPVVAATRAIAAVVKHSSAPTPGGTGRGTTPNAPSGPSPNMAGAAAAAASGGLSSGLWCVLILVLLAPLGEELRRRRVRPILAGPVGVVSLLQRPG
jgi:hypothetical protein